MTIFDERVARVVRADPVMRRLVVAHGAPEPFRREPGFGTLILLILEQQVSLDSAAAAFGRLRRRGAVTPGTVLSLTDDELRAIGFSRQKARYARALATAIEAGDLDLGLLTGLDDDTVRRALTAIPGIGPWTADIYLLAVLDRPDVWPVGDRALQVGVAEALDLESVPSPAELAEIGERWRPDRSTAARVVWHAYLMVRGRAAPSA